jgi:hypothetical protein
LHKMKHDVNYKLAATYELWGIWYCTISTYSSALVTCDRHEEMRISSVTWISRDTSGISSAELVNQQ